MNELSIERIWVLIKLRHRFILASCIFAVLLASIVGVASPSYYRSEALVLMPPPPQTGESMVAEGLYLLRSVSLAKSPSVLLPVARSLVVNKQDRIPAVAPRSLSVLDFDERWGLFKDFIVGGGNSVQQSSGAAPEILSILMLEHMGVDRDDAGRSLKIWYEAGSPIFAQAICQQIVDEFVSRSLEETQHQFKRQEEYLNVAIQRQLKSLGEVEQKMYRMVQAYPEVSVSKGDYGAAAAVAQKFVEKGALLHRLEAELRTNEKSLETIRNSIASQPGSDTNISTDTVNKIIQEIGVLEFHLAQYTKLGGYSKDHPEIQSIQSRIMALQRMLTSNEVPGADGQARMLASDVGIKDLFDTRSELISRTQRLRREREEAEKELAAENLNFKSILKVNFAFDALVRDLKTNVDVVNELHREMQRTQMMMAGSNEKPKVLSNASLPVYSSSISLRKRVFFGAGVGLVLSLTLLIFLDVLNPTLILLNDLSSLGLKCLGKFNRSEKAFSQIASTMVALREIKSQRKDGGPVVAGILPVGVTSNFEPSVMGIIKELSSQKQRVGLVVVVDPSRESPEVWWGDQIETRTVAQELAPSQLPGAIEALKPNSEWIFVVTSLNVNFPVENFIAASADCFFYVLQVGKTDLKSVFRVRSSAEYPVLLDHYALAFA